MSDDAAFIAGIREYSQDDTPRLVYADWLEEQGCAEKADYLRLVHALTSLPEDAPERAVLVVRLLEVAELIEIEWRDQVASRFNVIIEGWVSGVASVFVDMFHWMVGSRPPSTPQPDRPFALKVRTDIRREEAEAFMNEADPLRFQPDRESKSIFRIVRAANVATLPDQP